ncbi:trypsin-like peptidase domain-containing protein [Sphingomonas sp. AR_OL41]|uniref:S1C family serine protease n=1 Tax=Sphingomonas sp. AR_OL41 TaxID=3042729 RepID=UPI00247FDC50|nr:trypsin-like peptidase domain-containing protein [Sphingomonas sp. AR_OL41]MDH7971111.1 trypsin-like peptidase domain-containing protein [Sphingomonas sp. AR_OL41]
MNAQGHGRLIGARGRNAIAALLTLALVAGAPSSPAAPLQAAAPSTPRAATAQPSPARSLTPAEIARLAIPSIVLIRTPTGQGSGFFAGGAGRIVTNYHVIRGESEAVIVTADRVEHKDVEVIAIDKARDLAVLRIGGGGNKPLALGDSQAAGVGEHVVAIGNPLGLGDTVSDGLLSGVREFGDGVGVLQISAPISPGSSGGPVLNDRGEVIGIATFVVNSGQNLNFAVPINAAKTMLGGGVGKPLSAFVEAGSKGGLVRHIPHLPAATLKDCPTTGLRATYEAIIRAINLGAPLYNDGNAEATYRIYAGAAREVESTVSACAGPKAALANGVANADKLSAWSDKAWAMRDAFDGLIALLETRGPDGGGAAGPAPGRTKPALAAGALAGCASGDLDKVAGAIRSAVAVGAPLYEAGNAEATFRIYAGAVAEIDRQTTTCPAPRALLDQSLRDADLQHEAGARAALLRDAFDAVAGAIERGHPARKDKP